MNYYKDEKVVKALTEFVEDETAKSMVIGDMVVIKQRYRNVQILYSKFKCGSKINEIITNFEYAGIYSIVTKKFYGLKHPFMYHFDSEYNQPCISLLETKIEKGVKKLIAEYITENHDEYFKGMKVIDYSNLDKLFKIHASDDFFKGEPKELIEHIYINWGKYYDKRIVDVNFDEVIDYIEDPTKCLKEIADKIIKTDKESLFRMFCYYKKYINTYNEIEQDDDNYLHRTRAIKNAVYGTKTVHVTIIKNGKKLRFRTESKPLRVGGYNCDSYNKWYIKASDRAEYENLFGCSEYKSDEIVEITYRRKVLYSKG